MKPILTSWDIQECRVCDFQFRRLTKSDLGNTAGWVHKKCSFSMLLDGIQGFECGNVS